MINGCRKAMVPFNWKCVVSLPVFKGKETQWNVDHTEQLSGQGKILQNFSVFLVETKKKILEGMLLCICP